MIGGATTITAIEIAVVVLLGSALACYIAAFSARHMPRWAGRLFLVIGACLVALLWLDQAPAFFSGFLKYGIAILILIGLIAFALRAPLPSLDHTKINIGIVQAHQLHFGGATPADEFRIIRTCDAIQLEYAKKDNVRFCFGIDKGKENDGLPLTNLRMWMSFPLDSGISVATEQITPEDDDRDPYHEWKRYRENKCFYDFKHPINQRRVNTWRCLRLSFAKAGDYQLTFTITAEGIPEITRLGLVRVHHPANRPTISSSDHT